jgi:hypothetical protein
MEMPIVIGIAAVALLLVRHLAARRVAARRGRFVWLMFIPTLFGSVVIVWASVQLFAVAPLVGVPLTIAGLVYLAVVVRFLTRISRSVTMADPQEDLGAAMTEPLVDYMTSLMGLWLISGLLAVVGLIIWGVSQAAR